MILENHKVSPVCYAILENHKVSPVCYAVLENYKVLCINSIMKVLKVFLNLKFQESKQELFVILSPLIFPVSLHIDIFPL